VVDCLVVGGGPAGLTAAIYLGRYRRLTTVIDDGASRAVKIPESHNYPGFKGIGGRALLQRLQEQALQYGAVFEKGRVTSLHRQSDGVFVARYGQSEIHARSVLLATGLVDECPDFDGLGEGVYHDAVRYCPICDGYEALDKRIGIIGPIKSAGSKALFLKTYSQTVSLFATDGDLSGAESRSLTESGVVIVERPVRVEHEGDGIVVTAASGARYTVDVLYPALGCNVRSELAINLGATCSESGNLMVDDHQRTAVPGLFAAGDVVTDLHQLTVAAGHAAIAATAMHNSLPRNFR
jgi:thioredoxin reductase (NADPH)